MSFVLDKLGVGDREIESAYEELMQLNLAVYYREIYKELLIYRNTLVLGV
jgi:hypothetical protein